MNAGAIFDVDGTLVDSNDAHANAWVEALREAGHEVPFPRVRRLIGMGGDKLLAELLDYGADGERTEPLTRRRGEIFLTRWLGDVRPFPEARALISHLRASGTAVALATSARREELEALLGILEMPELIERATTSDDAERSKPDPDIVVAAIDLLGLPRADLLMVGDTPYDLEAAHRAGISFVGFRCGGYTDAELPGAIACFDGPQALLAAVRAQPLLFRRR